MLALQRQVRATWLATLENDSVLCREHGPELDLEPLGVELAFALVATRVLDLEVFARGCGDAYEQHRASCVEGRVVDGMTLMRNAETHLPMVVNPQVARALSAPFSPTGPPWPFSGQFRLFPSWLTFDELPAEVRETEKTRPRCKMSYRDCVAGKLILDTLLDAVRFFYDCDPSLAALDEDGALRYFPLPDVLGVPDDRRHPLEDGWQSSAANRVSVGPDSSS
jgi:hypothetical protein